MNKFLQENNFVLINTFSKYYFFILYTVFVNVTVTQLELDQPVIQGYWEVVNHLQCDYAKQHYRFYIRLVVVRYWVVRHRVWMLYQILQLSRSIRYVISLDYPFEKDMHMLISKNIRNICDIS